MGMMKDYAIEQQQRKNNERLATYLGITYDEFVQTEATFNTQTGNDDVVYGYYLTFPDEAPVNILKKIKGIDLANRMVDIDLNWDKDADE